MRGGRIALAVVVGLCMALATGCSRSQPQSQATPSAAAETDLTPYLEQVVQWQQCPTSDDFLDEIPSGAQCATVEVPVDYFSGASDRGTMQIALIRLAAQGESKGSLLVNPGGPGASGFDTVAQGAAGLQRNLPGYDIVGFDPRGVSRSAGFDCKQNDARRLDGIEADFTPEDPAEFDRVYTEAQAYKEACREAYPNWGFLGTASVARDVYVISRALGDEGINYYGISYGSVIGYELLRTYPQQINRMILESVVDPAVEEPLADQMAAFNDQLEELIVQCATPQHLSCGQGRSAEQVRQAFIEAAKDVENPRNTTLTGNAQPSEALVYYGMVLPLYLELDDDLRSLYIDAIGAFINDGDVQQFEFWGYLYNNYDFNESKFLAADDTQQVVLCLDEATAAAETDIAEERAKDQQETADIQQRAPLLAAIGFSDAYTGDDRAYEPCSYSRLAYEDPAIPDPLPVAAEVVNPGGVPVLLLAVTGDTATPYAWSTTVGEQLGVPVVSQDTTGHGVYSDTDNQCTIDIVTRYLDSGALPDGPVTC